MFDFQHNTASIERLFFFVEILQTYFSNVSAFRQSDLTHYTHLAVTASKCYF